MQISGEFISMLGHAVYPTLFWASFTSQCFMATLKLWLLFISLKVLHCSPSGCCLAESCFPLFPLLGQHNQCCNKHHVRLSHRLLIPLLESQ